MHKNRCFIEITYCFVLFCIVVIRTALHCRVLKLADKPSCLGGEDKRDKRKVMG
jgi:hypothetical protein